MKLVSLLFASLVLTTGAVAQTTVSSSGTNDALGASIAKMSSSLIRIAYLDGSSSDGTGTAIHIRDYNASMTYQGETTITAVSGVTSPRFSIPRLSRDGRGVVWYSSINATGTNTTTVAFAELKSTAYSGTETQPTVYLTYNYGANGGDGVIDSTMALARSTAISSTARLRPPAISNKTFGSNTYFVIVWPDLHDDSQDPGCGGRPNATVLFPLMQAIANSSGYNYIHHVSNSDQYSSPAINSTADKIAYVSGSQVYESGFTASGSGTPSMSGTTYVVSHNYSNSGVGGNGTSSEPQIDGSGDHVVFTTTSTDLRASDTNNMQDVYLWSSGTLSLPYSDPGEYASSAASSPNISADGGYVSFLCTNHNLLSSTVNYGINIGPHAYRWKVADSSLILCSRITTLDVNGKIQARSAAAPAVSDDGFFVFDSVETDIASGDRASYRDVIERHS
ncbi:hypothetical protein [Fimbriimonas ginsengisoli]|uniref:WD40 domain protein n=1 Tax=Fimbriimonas ginsengisoli Gsoil 348 TaxID=661478 RepID=A0A068NQU0_FIMGI|nr:hypothetical protein [Fimbriimonas ginsengisoli]AIE85918.1 WD40 domain protein [Fimbriimonas ginsengisoli Gsoil 348]